MANNNLTKTAIANSLKKLMETQSIKKISVTDICSDCNINRKTFYYHFSDKYELISWIFDDEVFEYTLEKNESLYSYDGALFFLTCIYNDKDFYFKAFQELGPESLREHLSKVLKPIIDEVIEPDDFEKEFTTLSDVFTDFLVSSILRWLNSYPVLTPEKYLEQLISVGSLLSIKLAKLFLDIFK